MTRTRQQIWRSRGFTLIEILMTIVVIGILATVALRSLQSGIDQSRIRETQEEMDELVMAIAGNPGLYANGLRSDFGYVGDVGSVPSTLDNLMTNPGSYATWKGPYMGRRFTQDADGYKRDAWGNLYTFTSGITISSTGAGATAMTKSAAAASTDLTSTPVIGTITDAAGNPPGDSSVAITVRITYPNGTGSTTSATTSPNNGGAFSISGIPIGNHTITAVYRATADTVYALASSLPKTGAFVNFRLPGSPFASSGGGGGASGSIVYVSGSAQTNGNDIEFQITNNGGSTVTITSLVATYTHTPSGYFKKVKWNGSTVFDQNNPRAGSGDTVNLSSSKTLAVGATATISLESFKDAPTGGDDLTMSNTTFTITFSDGSVITFNSGA
ncbi:MAG: prepilin-type N-terminal cleavage/methylation domain-containing protein [candidate division Zixibacteria bacterium]|nr:prepilin-type N-terminal cleavage/methylation domain-containing protein [candidate division Zixibacteria bacterium]